MLFLVAYQHPHTIHMIQLRFFSFLVNTGPSRYAARSTLLFGVFVAINIAGSISLHLMPNIIIAQILPNPPTTN